MLRLCVRDGAFRVKLLQALDHVHSDGGFLGPLGCVQRLPNPEERRAKAQKGNRGERFRRRPCSLCKLLHVIKVNK